MEAFSKLKDIAFKHIITHVVAKDVSKSFIVKLTEDLEAAKNVLELREVFVDNELYEDLDEILLMYFDE